MKKRSAISQAALEAKKRLRNYGVKSETQQITYKQANFSKEDLALYKKVINLLNQNKIVLNPILELVDKTLYSKLNTTDRQKYIMSLTAKYKQMKDQYEREKSRTEKQVSNY